MTFYGSISPSPQERGPGGEVNCKAASNIPIPVTFPFQFKATLLLIALLASQLPAGGQEADTADEQRAETPPAAGSPARPVVPPGYYLFPIAPGQPGFLSASMGEIRPNHFHGGLDIKTGGQVNRPVYAAADGYISRLKQSAFGYGNVLYITHPNGTTTVYGHLNEFEGAVAAELLRQQYEKETYELELFFEPGQHPVKRGEQVGLSGNTGGSGGPHLHWEVRDAQDRQYNPLQWGGFPEIQDHIAPTLQALAVEPLSIEARVKGVFDKQLLVPKVAPPAGQLFAWPDTIACYGTVGLLLQGFDRFDKAANRNGIQRVTMRVNGQPFYEHRIDAIPFPVGTRQVNNFVDYQYHYQDGRTLQKLWVDAGNDLDIYTTATPGQGRLEVVAGQVYTVDITLADSYNNQTPLRLVLRGEQPAYFKTAAPAPKKAALRYEVTRDLLKATATDNDTAAISPNLLLFKNNKRLEVRPSYTRQGEATYLYDLRAGLPDSLRVGRLSRRFDRQTLIRAGREAGYTTGALHLGFGANTLFDNLYLNTSYRPEAKGSGFWTVGTPADPLYYPLRLTLLPPAPPADPARTAIYEATLKGGKSYVGGKWDAQGRIAATVKRFASYRILTDTIAPQGRLLSRPGGQLLFKVGDDMSGLARYRLLVGGKFRLLRYEYKNATLFTVAGDTLGPRLRGPAELHLTDQAGNKRVVVLNL